MTVIPKFDPNPTRHDQTGLVIVINTYRNCAVVFAVYVKERELHLHDVVYGSCDVQRTELPATAVADEREGAWLGFQVLLLARCQYSVGNNVSTFNKQRGKIRCDNI